MIGRDLDQSILTGLGSEIMATRYLKIGKTQVGIFLTIGREDISTRYESLFIQQNQFPE